MDSFLRFALDRIEQANTHTNIMESHISEQAEESATAVQSSETADDRRATIEGEASLVGPPLLLKLEHLSVNTTSSDPPLPSVGSMAAVRASPSPPTTTEAPASAPAVIPRGTETPEGNRRSPAEGNSPSTSQVSVGSVGPTLLAAALMPRHHYDLTPVTRNTERYVDEKDGAGIDNNIVSPEEELHGENLAMPSNFVSSTEGPSLPPLQGEGSALNEQMLWHHEAQIQEQQQLDEPIQFPSRKAYTFTSREQYEEDLLREQREQPPPHASSSDHLRPYQPSRQEDLEGVGSIPPEVVSQIFARRQDDESHANHRLELLQRPIPLEDRQASIPSLHLAHPLHGSNTQSFTDHTTEGGDDEESLQYVGQDDGDSLDASLSSRTSSLYLPDETTATQPKQQDTPILSLAPAHSDTVVMEELSRVMADDTHRKRKRRQQKRAMADWLHNLKADPEQLAEAASSKFLTGKKTTTDSSNVQTKQPRRQTLPIRSVVSDEQQAEG